ncbi:hypothetical protein GOP47_0003723 [Adiantum capillus-veneris]|uniref:F-box domain-containing protein n=1 Tax=Adiantum capillus-veneris TaxID=13818 RepID=A0A9D4V6U3_ADICA|nr:hypothetical protein GOP47_0003723 [Adiantum capillus-veneris]
MRTRSQTRILKTMPLSGIYGGICEMKASLGEVSSSNCEGGAEQLSKRHSFYQCWSAAHGQVLDQELWGKLPVELLERIIGSLPLDAMLRMRSVCKAWKAYVSSYGFAHLCYRTPSSGPWCLAVMPEWGAIAVYDADLDKWHLVPLPNYAAKHNMQPFSAGGGLVCFKSVDNSSFLVYNPLTKSCSALTPKRRGTGLDKDKVWVVTDESEGFIIVVVRESGRCEVYDSFNNQWSKPGWLPHNVSLSQESFQPARSVASDGTLYLIVGPPYDVVAYDTITGSWSRLYLQWPEQSWDHVLSEDRGRIYLLAFHREKDTLLFSEWELHSATRLWVKVETMPSLFCLEPYAGSNKKWQLQSFANRNLVLLQFTYDSSNQYLVLYNRAMKSWTKISQLPSSIIDKH